MADIPIREITPDLIRKARDRLKKRGLAPTTQNHYMAVVRQVLRAAVEWRWLDAAPKIPMAKLPPSEPRWITREQFLCLVERLPPHSADMARLAVATGLRRTNITGLTWDRVDLERGVAWIPAPQAKAGRGIAVPLNRDAIEAIARWVGRHPKWVFVFRGKRVTQVATRAWRRACRETGHPGLRFHDLRHTWASWQVQAETPLSVVQALGGWQSASMVQRYAHLSPGHLAEYADRTNIGTPQNLRGAKTA